MRDQGPAWIASRRGIVNEVLIALRKGASTGESNASGATCMHVAAQRGHCGVVAALLRVGASATGCYSGSTAVAERNLASPLVMAIVQGHTSIMRARLSHPTSGDVNQRCRGAWTASDACVDSNDRYDGRAAIFRYSHYFSVFNVESRCPEGVSDLELSPLQVAVAALKPEAVQCLLGVRDVDVHICTRPQKQSLLHLAILAKQSAFCACRMWLYRTGECERCGSFVKVISILAADDRIDPNTCDAIGQSPLHHAIYRAQEASALALIHCFGSRLDVRTPDATGDSILHAAVRLGMSAVVEAVASMPTADINIRNLRGDTPLHIALKAVDRVELHKSHQSKSSEWWALRRATGIPPPPVVAPLLLAPRVDLNVKDAGGMTALTLLTSLGIQTPEGARSGLKARLRLKLEQRDARRIIAGSIAAEAELSLPTAEIVAVCSAQRCANPATHRCTRCKVVGYCSSACQAADWRTRHKTMCRA